MNLAASSANSVPAAVPVVPKAQELLSEPEIAAFINSHQGAASEIKQAAERLAGEPDGSRALKKLLPALSKKVVFVFFSYKKKDEETAKAVVDVLRQNSAEKLQITYQDDFTKEIVGKKWREKIRNTVCRANWFILLLPDPADDWDWPLYESGLFEAQLTSADRLICLHHPDTKVPDPIEGYHAVAAIKPEVEKLLRMIYVEENPICGMSPINKAIEGKIPELAEEIIHAISPPKKKLHREIFEPWVELRVENAEGLENRDDLDQALIESANKEALDLFDFIQRPKTWGELRSGVQENPGDGRWREELFHVIRRIAAGRKFFPIQAVFSSRDGKMYRPVACAIDRIGEDGSIESFHITFSEEVSTFDVAAIPEEMSALATLLRFTFRFRWEVLERFGKTSITEDDVERLENALRRINKDWESRGIGGEEFITRLFSLEQAKHISKMFATWNAIKNPEGSGELDIAIENKETEKIPRLLASVIPMNQEFLEMAADRFSELVSSKS